MDSRLLIDAIVRQTTLLIAALSTASGIRAPLAHIADQVFLDLAKEIESHGIGRKIVADMFGLALRTYQQKVQRLAESVSQRNRSLWEAVYQRVLEHGEQRRDHLEDHFGRDSVEDVGAVLHDLVASGLLQSQGRGREALYRAQAPGEHDIRARDQDALTALVWFTIYRRGANTVPALSEALAVSADTIDTAVARLVSEGRVRKGPNGELRADVFTVPVGEKRGWEAAVFDHFSAVASAIATKVQLGPGSRASDRVGGATLSFDIWDGHPYADQVYALLSQTREAANELWNRVAMHEPGHAIPEDAKVKVTFYFGQNVQQSDAFKEASDEDEHA